MGRLWKPPTTSEWRAIMIIATFGCAFIAAAVGDPSIELGGTRYGLDLANWDRHSEVRCGGPNSGTYQYVGPLYYESGP